MTMSSAASASALMSSPQPQHDVLLYRLESLDIAPQVYDPLACHHPHAQGLALVDCSLPFALQSVAGESPSPHEDYTLWSQHMPATPDVYHDNPSMTGYDCSSAVYQIPSPPTSIQGDAPYSLASTPIPESCSPSPLLSGGVSARSSVSCVTPTSRRIGTEHDAGAPVLAPALAGAGDGLAEWAMHPFADMNARGSPIRAPPSPDSSYENERGRIHGGPSLRSSVSPPLASYSARRGSRTRLQPAVPGMLGPRRKRQYTTAEEANHKCQKCGKYFHRRYNYRAHLATHDPNREYAHVCHIDWCKKKFARKTDLTRHYQSVHLKQRNYECELCGNMFARKDTLRRHIEDGCSKRFEISSDLLQLSSESGAPPTSPSPAPQRISPPGPMDLANGTGHMFTTSVMHPHQPLAAPSQPPHPPPPPPPPQAPPQPLAFDGDSTACMPPSMLSTSATDAAGSAGGVASTLVDLSSTSPAALSAATAAAAMHGPHGATTIITAENGCYWYKT